MIGEPSAAFVEKHDAAKVAKTRLVIFDVRHETRCHDESGIIDTCLRYSTWASPWVYPHVVEFSLPAYII
jgi:hypothetical protein